MIIFRGKKISPKKIKKILLGRFPIWEPEQEILKLGTPVIRLEIDGEVQPSVPEGMTPAILGIAILGRTILGVTSVLPKLSAPSIRLIEEEAKPKLDAPIISLWEGEEPVTPVKLGTPVIRLVEIEDGNEPVVPSKLDAPVIRIEIIEDGEEPVELVLSISGDVITWNEVPGAGLYRLSGIKRENGSGQNIDFTAAGSFDLSEVESTNDNYDIKDGEHTLCMTAYLSSEELTVLATSNEVIWNNTSESEKLEAPVIYLEVVDDEEPEEPVEPIKLDAPVIQLVEVSEEEAVPEAPVLTFDEDAIFRNMVEGALGYRWYYRLESEAEDTAHPLPNTSGTGIYLPEQFGDKEDGTYIIWCVAYNSGGISERSNEIIYVKGTAALPKLAAPVIELVVVGEEEPDVPDIPDVPVKLDAPVITLEVIDDTEPEEPEEPVVPDIPVKLTSPVIRLEVIEEEEPIVLEKPKNLYIENGVLYWDEVPNAEYYRVLFRFDNGTEQTSGSMGNARYETQFNFMNGWLMQGYGTYEFYIRAYADGGNIESENSDSVSYVYAPEVVKLSAPVIRLEEVSEEHQHNYNAVVITFPTCTEQGYTTYSCSCGAFYVDDYVDAKGHTEVIDSAVESTCTEAGLTEGKHCSVCGEVLTAQQAIPAKGHRGEIIQAVMPTCTETGLTEGERCSVCGTVLVEQEIVPATGHSYGEEYYSDEFSTGYGKRCSDCGDLVALEPPEVTPKLETPVIRLEETVALTAPVPVIDGNIISWEAVPGATDYFLLCDYEQSPTISVELNGVKYGLLYMTPGTSIDLAAVISKAGDWTLYVSATDGAATKVSAPVEFTLAAPKLNTPAIRITDKKIDPPIAYFSGTRLAWTGVLGAEGYGIVYSAGNSSWHLAASVAGNAYYYDFAEFFETLEPGEYLFCVYAVSDTEVGEWSEPVKYTIE